MREICRGILTWAKRSERHGYDFNGFLIRDPRGNVCIDPVEPSEEELPERVVDDPPMLRASVRRLRELDFDALLVGDGESIVNGARDRMRELAASF